MFGIGVSETCFKLPYKFHRFDRVTSNKEAKTEKINNLLPWQKPVKQTSWRIDKTT